MVTKSKTIVLYDGVKKRIYARGETEAEAIKKLADMEAGKLTLNDKMSLATWAAEWLETYLKPSVKPNVYTLYESILRLHILPVLGGLTLNRVKPIQIQRCVNEMEDMSNSMLRKTRIVLSSMFRDAKLNQLIHDDPVLGVKWPQGYSNERRALTPEERQLFMKVIAQHPRGALFGTMYGCGLRPGEARALRWNDIKDGSIYVQHAIKKEGEMLGTTKSKSGQRTVPMPPWLKDMISDLPKSSVFVFPDSKGSYINTRRLRDSWNSLLRLMYLEAGVSTYRNQLVEDEMRQCSFYDITMYYLRHTYATILIENGVDIRTVQYLMGHANIGVTSKIYAHVTNAVVAAARGKIDKIDFTTSPTVQTAGQITYLPSAKAK